MPTKREKPGLRASSASTSHLFSSALPLSSTSSTLTTRRQPKIYYDIQSASDSLLQATPRSSTLTTSTSSQGLAFNRRSNRAAGFQVFCDPSNSPPRALTSSTRPPARRRLEANTMVIDKENKLPEFEDLLPPKRPLRPKHTNSTMLAEKKPVQAQFLPPCLDKWAGKKPFEACSPDRPLRNSQPHSIQSRRSIKPPQLPLCGGSRLDATIYCSSTQQATRELLKQEAMHEVTSLVAQLEVIEAVDYEDVDGAENVQIDFLEPLPVDAVCPGAPKPVATITLPAFDHGHDLDDDNPPLQVLTCHGTMSGSSKSPNTFQMSPLAEVTEAYTGLQGGWSPPVESWSPVLCDEMSNMVRTVHSSIHSSTRLLILVSFLSYHSFQAMVLLILLNRSNLRIRPQSLKIPLPWMRSSLTALRLGSSDVENR